MHKYIRHACAAAGAGVALSMMGMAGAGASAVVPQAASMPAEAGSPAAGAPGTQSWAERYNSHGGYAYSVAVSPDGSRVFVTGSSYSATTSYDYGTIAYNATTGTQEWAKTYNGPGNSDDIAHSVAVSPDGKTVYVTGQSYGGTTSNVDYATVAYNAATGARLWAARYSGPGSAVDIARSVAVNPDGKTVYVTGSSQGAGVSQYDAYATIAYNATTGAKLWAERYSSPTGSNAYSVGVSPDGKTVYVTGVGTKNTPGFDYATIAYNATTGAKLWLKTSNSVGPSGLTDSLAVSPTGTTVFVTGENFGGGYATIAYNATSGAQEWVKSYTSPGGTNVPNSVTVSPDGTTVYVTGQSAATTGFDYATVAYNAATGARKWATRYNGTGNSNDFAYSVAVSPDGKTVYVTGQSYGGTTFDDYATVAYNTATGVQQWVKRYNGPGNGEDIAYSVAVSPTTGTVYVTGFSNRYWATLAYNG